MQEEDRVLAITPARATLAEDLPAIFAALRLPLPTLRHLLERLEDLPSLSADEADQVVHQFQVEVQRLDALVEQLARQGRRLPQVVD
jgi:signal transduction histidine kinase